MRIIYFSDYFDGGGDTVDRPQPTGGGWFQPVWERDFPIMQSLGANTLRLYANLVLCIWVARVSMQRAFGVDFIERTQI
jgi:hypothetical protein